MNVKHKKLFIALGLILVAPILFSGKVLADPSCTSGFLCYWDAGNYRSADGQDRITLNWRDKPGHNFNTGNGSVKAGETITLDLGYSSVDSTSKKIITWVNIPGGHTIIQNMSTSAGGYADVNSCFNVLIGGPKLPTSPPEPYDPAQGSPYRNVNWETSPGGTVLCDSRDKKDLGPFWRGDITNGGSSAAWLKNGEGPNSSRTYQLSMTIRPDAAGKTFCLRNHVSVTINNVSLPLTTAQVSGGSLDNMMAISGHRIGNGDPMCFTVSAAPPPSSSTNATCEYISVTAPNDGQSHRVRIFINDGDSSGQPNDSPTPLTSDNYDNYDPSQPDPDWILASGETRLYDLVANRKMATAGKPLVYTVYIFQNATGPDPANPAGNPLMPGVGPTGGNSGAVTVENCFRAECSINDFTNVPGAPPGSGAVKAGQPILVNVTVTNTGSNDLSSGIPPDHHLALTTEGDGRYRPNPPPNPPEHPLGVDLAKGQSTVRGIWINPGGGIAGGSITFFPAFARLIFLSPGGCSHALNTFLEYNFDATAATAYDPDKENPGAVTGVRLTSTLKQNGTSVNGSALRQFYREHNGAATPAGSAVENAPPAAEFGNRTFNDIRPIVGGVLPGAAYCVVIMLDHGHGWRGPAETYYNNTPEVADNCVYAGEPGCTGSCAEIFVNIPYVRTYGADVASGGGFGAGCNNNGEGIFAFMRPINEQRPSDGTSQSNKSGSGTQLAAMALGAIEGFTSASTRTATAPPNIGSGKALTFGHNNGPLTGNPLSPNMGGDMTGNGWCMPDYYNETQYPGPPQKSTVGAGTITVGSRADRAQTLVNAGGGKITIEGNGAPNYNNRHTVYVDGDAYIRNNIMYKTNYAGGAGSIPSFTLIVRGSIFIDSNVSQLDGLYIAQPNGNAGSGRIFTCADVTGNAITDPVQLFNDCGAAASAMTECPAAGNKQLVVNGAFIADRVVLNRTGYSLRCSSFREPALTSKAAEIFNFSPEMYISPPFFSPRSTFTSGDFDYISSLPPIL